ncbi:hypothetical protein XHV734_1943 [Xanthomonas hortorum pv. vitians]|nr:hypothetical protein XHV734_1943 [Xanthomonas hortorum pv. vitians]
MATRLPWPTPEFARGASRREKDVPSMSR